MMYEKEEALPLLKEALEKNRLSIFVGSGVSVDSNLPTWDGFVDKYINICETLNKSLRPEMQFTKILEDARTHKEKDLIGTITALKNKITECRNKGINTDFCNDKLNKFFYAAQPNEYRHSIVGTNYRQIITTNYDDLLESAAEEDGFNTLLTRSFSYSDNQSLSAAIYSRKTSIIHAHGKVADIKLDEYILTREDYQKIMKHNAAFRLIINSVFLTNSVLFVGYGGSDPHFEDIINDLNAIFDWGKSDMELPRCYIMLRKDKITPIREFLNRNNRIDIIGFDEYDQMKTFLRELKNAYPRSGTVREKILVEEEG